MCERERTYASCYVDNKIKDYNIFLTCVSECLCVYVCDRKYFDANQVKCVWF